MRILHIHSSFGTGGIETMVNALANEMSSLGENVSVCSIFKPSRDQILWTSLSPKITKFSLDKVSTGISFKEIFKIYRLIKRENFDVVHIHGFFAYYMLSSFLLHHKIKFVYTVHSDAKMEGGIWDRRLFLMKKYFFRHKWLHPVTISPESQRSFSEYYHNCDNILIPNGIKSPDNDEVDLSEFRNTTATKLLINVGRIDVPKNQVTLCKCVTRLINENYDVALIIAGPISEVTIMNQIKTYLSDRVHYIGSINNASSYFRNCNALVMPSIYEGLPVTLLEAMSVGCLPICSPIGGMKNVIINGKNGLLSDSADESDYYNCLLRYLSTPEEDIKEMEKQAENDFHQKYHISITAKKYLDYYHKITSI